MIYTVSAFGLNERLLSDGYIDLDAATDAYTAALLKSDTQGRWFYDHVLLCGMENGQPVVIREWSNPAFV